MSSATRPPHGTFSCYNRGCRRDECRTAYRNHRKHADLRRSRGLPGHIDTASVAAHLHRLAESGWDRHDIADKSGVSYRTITYVLSGQRTMQTRNAAKILALKPLTQAPRVDSTGTRRRIQALAAIGWPIIHTAQQAGHSPAFVFRILNGWHTTVPRATAERVELLYRTHICRPGPSQHARTVAARNGWLGPLAWGDDIDDPAAQPEVDTTGDEPLKRDDLGALRRLEMRHLASFGTSEHEIAGRLGLRVQYVHDTLKTLREAA